MSKLHHQLSRDSHIDTGCLRQMSILEEIFLVFLCIEQDLRGTHLVDEKTT
jgi:hypothetical protein